jgi:pSer/pThr/pTyr-binding forkhead associated (FHA) protein
MANALKYKHSDVPRQPNEKARLKVVQGPDVGVIYVITGNLASIGRGDENDVVLSDLKASRVHAVMALTQTGKWKIRDQGSVNGILFNSQPTREAEITLNDTISVGETMLEFVSADAATQILRAPARSSAQIQAQQANFQMARDRINQPFGGRSGKSKASGGNTKTIVYIVVGCLTAALLFMGDPPKKTKSKGRDKNDGKAQDLSSFLPAPDPNKAAETLFKDGLREYFARNYGRARTQFETVLQITPGHVLATLYLENCNNKVSEEVKLHLSNGKKSFEAGKLRESKGHFETILRLLFKDQSNPAYIEAKEQLDKVAKALKGEEPKS